LFWHSVLNNIFITKEREEHEENSKKHLNKWCNDCNGSNTGLCRSLPVNGRAMHMGGGIRMMMTAIRLTAGSGLMEDAIILIRKGTALSTR